MGEITLTVVNYCQLSVAVVSCRSLLLAVVNRRCDLG